MLLLLPTASSRTQLPVALPLLWLLLQAGAQAEEEGPAARLPASRFFVGTEQGAACLDGSTPTYYVMKGDPSKFYLHMEGGGWCSSLDDCAQRASTSTGSSKYDGPTTDLAGLVSGWGAWYLSNETSCNPMMASWTKVLVSYCDGASWAGLNRTTTVHRGRELHFRGKANLDALIGSLKAQHSFADATDVVVSGGSAGGLATYLHTDTFRAALPGSRVVGMPDAGFFIDNSVSVASGWRDQVRWAALQQNTSAGVPPACLAHYAPEEQWRCFFAQYAAPFVKAPLFALQSQYDAYQTSAEIKSRDPHIVNLYGLNLSRTLEEALQLLGDTTGSGGRNPPTTKHGAFLDSCWHHSGAWPSLQIDNTTAWDAMAAWYAMAVTYKHAVTYKQIDNTTAWDAMAAWYKQIHSADAGTRPGRRYWKQAAPSGFPCQECCPATHPPACDGGCTSCCGPLWG